MRTTNTKPPVEIFTLLHETEKHGVKLPKSIDDWWIRENEGLIYSKINQQALTCIKPSTDIYDVLHDAEKHGVELPKCIEEWWFLETTINESKRNNGSRNEGEK